MRVVMATLRSRTPRKQALAKPGILSLRPKGLLRRPSPKEADFLGCLSEAQRHGKEPSLLVCGKGGVSKEGGSEVLEKQMRNGPMEGQPQMET